MEVIEFYRNKELPTRIDRIIHLKLLKIFSV
jgi:hypothetical protein